MKTKKKTVRKGYKVVFECWCVGQWYFELQDEHGQFVFESDDYSRRSHAVRGWERFRAAVAKATIAKD